MRLNIGLPGPFSTSVGGKEARGCLNFIGFSIAALLVLVAVCCCVGSVGAFLDKAAA